MRYNTKVISVTIKCRIMFFVTSRSALTCLVQEHHSGCLATRRPSHELAGCSRRGNGLLHWRCQQQKQCPTLKQMHIHKHTCAILGRQAYCVLLITGNVHVTIPVTRNIAHLSQARVYNEEAQRPYGSRPHTAILVSHRA